MILLEVIGFILGWMWASKTDKKEKERATNN